MFRMIFFQKIGTDGGAEFTCLQSSCGHRVSIAEVSHRLQEITVDLEKAVALMERERPGACMNTVSCSEDLWSIVMLSVCSPFPQMRL